MFGVKSGLFIVHFSFRQFELSVMVCYLCNYLKINIDNLLSDEFFNFNNDLVNHH